MRTRRLASIACAVAAPVLIAGTVMAQTGVASAAVQGGNGGQHGTLYVSPRANGHNSDRSCGSARFRTIQSAVNAAPAGGTVVVCKGTYHEQVVVSKPLSLVGSRATIDETGVTPKFTVTLPGLGTQTIYAAVIITSSHVNLRWLTIQHNAVVQNDQGSINLGAKYFECAPEGSVPGDCGEGIHLTGVAYSSIRDNLSNKNSGGMLISDDTGPTHNNVIANNAVTNNTLDCGITVPGHNPAALNAKG